MPPQPVIVGHFRGSIYGPGSKLGATIKKYVMGVTNSRSNEACESFNINHQEWNQLSTQFRRSKDAQQKTKKQKTNNYGGRTTHKQQSKYGRRKGDPRVRQLVEMRSCKSRVETRVLWMWLVGYVLCLNKIRNKGIRSSTIWVQCRWCKNKLKRVQNKNSMGTGAKNKIFR